MIGLTASNLMQIVISVMFGAVCVGPVLALLIFSQWTANVAAIPRLEHQLNLIMKHLGIEDVVDSRPILQELRSGNKINAIKLYREQTGVGLKEAKDVIDALERGDIDILERGNGTA
jgi:hypothetical protein